MRLKYAVFCLLWIIFGVPLAFGAQKAPVKSGSSPALRFTVKPYEERQKGLPGYKAKVDFIETHSAVYPHAEDIGKYVNAQVLDSLFNARKDSASPNLADFCAETKRDAEACANELFMEAKSTGAIGALASLRYDFSYFPVGAAHPMHGVSTYNFSLKPLFRIESLSSFFDNDATALPIVQKQIREALMAKRDEEGKPLLEKDIVWEGTKDRQAFDTFILTKTGITVIFTPYAIAAYALGTQEVTLPYAGLQAELKPFYRKALGLE